MNIPRLFSKKHKNTTHLNQAARDYEVCKAVVSGDTQAFSILAAQYQKRVYLLGNSFFQDNDDCEDFVQDVMLKAYSALHTFRGEASFASWLMRIAYNTAVNSSLKKQRYTSLSEGIEIEYQGDNPEERHLNNCIVLSVRDAVNNLPDNYRICIDLYFFYDMSYVEIAAITELPLNTIKSHIFRAKKMLRDYLYEDRIIFENTRRNAVFPHPAALSSSKE